MNLKKLGSKLLAPSSFLQKLSIPEFVVLFLIRKRGMMPVHGAKEQIMQAVLTWEGVAAHSHRFGGTEFRLGRREIGHIHGDYLIDIPFPKKVRDEVIAAGRAEPHHILPQSGWISFYLHRPADVDRAIGLLRQSFELAAKQRSKKMVDGRR
jgi:predicted DNA-binding protein (MmcQ/YjbR family)